MCCGSYPGFLFLCYMEKQIVFKGQNDQVLTSSLLVAETFGKEHKRVLQDVRELKCSEYFRQHHFVLSSYTTSQNRDVPMFLMDRDGFTLLVMGYTGELAMSFKEKYIEAFNEMEHKLKESQKPLSQLEILVQSAQALLEQEQRITRVEEKLEAMEQERIENTEKLLAAPISNEKTPELSLRDNIRQLVNQYASSTGINHQDVWHKVYNQLYFLYHINLKAYKKIKKNETYLEVAERNLLLDKIFIIISNMIQERI